MVDSSPSVDPEDYPILQETIERLGRNYRSFDERSSNFPRRTSLPIIPGIHIPLQTIDDRSSRDILYGRGDIDAEQEMDCSVRAATGAETSTSTAGDGPSAEPDEPETGAANSPPNPPVDIDLIPPPPTGLGPMPYTKYFGNGPGGFTNEFREKYAIPDDVLVERVTGDRILFGEDFIVLPLYAITEGGVRFPMSPFLRYFLDEYKIAPIQVAQNTWRVLCSAIRLAERNNLPFTLGDLMLMYLVSRSPKYDRYYLTTRQHFDHLVDRLYDSEKWSNVLVKVSGNFEWGPLNPLLDYPFPTRMGSAVERPFRIPRRRGYPGLGYTDKPGIHFFFFELLNFLIPLCVD
jgi:hypothetical protein